MTGLKRIINIGCFLLLLIITLLQAFSFFQQESWLYTFLYLIASGIVGLWWAFARFAILQFEQTMQIKEDILALDENNITLSQQLEEKTNELEQLVRLAVREDFTNTIN